jgi:hypothetical protein
MSNNSIMSALVPIILGVGALVVGGLVLTGGAIGIAIINKNRQSPLNNSAVSQPTLEQFKQADTLLKQLASNKHYEAVHNDPKYGIVVGDKYNNYQNYIDLFYTLINIVETPVNNVKEELDWIKWEEGDFVSLWWIYRGARRFCVNMQVFFNNKTIDIPQDSIDTLWNTFSYCQWYFREARGELYKKVFDMSHVLEVTTVDGLKQAEQFRDKNFSDPKDLAAINEEIEVVKQTEIPELHKK